MSRSVVYRERESDSYEDQPRRTYTTVKRYQVPESRSTLGVEEDTTKEKITIRRERSAQPRERERDSEDINIRITERDRGAGRGDDYYSSERINVSESTRDRGRDSSYRVVEKESDYEDRRSRVDHRSSDYRSSFVERDTREVGGDDRVREYRFERDRDYSPGHRRRDDSYEVERYVKETDYYAPDRPQPPIIIREKSREPPQPIIIQEAAPQPIIIREAAREPRYEFVEHTRDESKSVVKSEAPPSPVPSKRSMAVTQQQQQQEEDYFYERRVIERERPPPPRSRHRDSYEIHPKDSASNYSSDDSYTHVKKSTTYLEDRDHSPHHKLHLAEGALVGAAAGEVLRHHRMSQGKPAGGRLTSGVGGAAVGALGAEAITRWRSRSRRRRSVSRSSSGSRRSGRSHHHDRRRSYSRSRSRSRSHSRSRHLAKYAGVAALGALGAYALTRKNKNETVIVNDGGRRRRRSTRRSLSEDDLSRDVIEDDKHRDPQHRNRRIAQAGLASAAAAGIIERVRSKSRGGKHRSKSRLKQGVPIAAAGLGGAALAGLYEKNKANKEAKRDAIIEDEINRGRQPSRSRSRRRGDRGYAYGSDPVYRDGPGGYYSDEEPAQYRRRGGSAESSPDNRRRSRSRNAHAAESAAAGAAGVGAYEMGRHREYEEYGDPWHGHGTGPAPNQYEEPSGYLPPGQHVPYPAQAQQPYPPSSYFPPPPTGNNAYATSPTQHNAYPTYNNNATPYNPADYAPGGPAATPANPYNNTRDLNANDTAAATHGNDAYAGNGHNNIPGTPQPPADQGRRGREGNNDVSSAPANASTNSYEGGERQVEDADPSSINAAAAPRARSSSRVRFNLDANQSFAAEKPRKDSERYSDSETHGDRKRRHHRRRRHRDHHDNRRHQGDDDNDSDDTIELPARFDEHGNRKGEGGADALQDLLGSLARGFLGGEEGDGGGRGRRHSHRH